MLLPLTHIVHRTVYVALNSDNKLSFDLPSLEFEFFKTNLTSLLLNDSVPNHTIIGSAISEASRSVEIKHAVRSKYDVKENGKKGALPTPVPPVRSLPA